LAQDCDAAAGERLLLVLVLLLPTMVDANQNKTTNVHAFLTFVLATRPSTLYSNTPNTGMTVLVVLLVPQRPVLQV
jgi:hypothetical protein